MKKGLTVAIVGAGSSYTPELIQGILEQSPDTLPITRLNLTDINPERLAIMAGLSARMIEASKRCIGLAHDTCLEKMLEGADFVITQLRVGGMKARYLDESIPLKYGIIGQETTGPGGMLKALRTIPPMLEIARAVHDISPNAFILNYTNPSGIITEAVSKYTSARMIGLCAGIPGIQEGLYDRFSSRYPDLRSYTVGLNHFGFVYRIMSGERDVTAEVIDLMHQEDTKADAIDINQFLGAVPISYVNYFFYHGDWVTNLKAKSETRAQEIERIERAILDEAANEATATKPEGLQSRGGGGYSAITFSVMKAIVNNTGAELTANVPNQGCVDGIEDNAVVELVCRVDERGTQPLPVGPIPLAFRGLVQALKAYETLTVEAAIHQDKRLAMLALLNHPLVGDLDIIEPLVNEMLAAHGLNFS